jgi:hypothetical protein
MNLFENILLLAADSSYELRPIDVDRIMESAYNEGLLEEFRDWLLSKNLMERTKKTVEEWEMDIDG